MSLPINDIFEGTGDLLIKHGDIVSNKHNFDGRGRVIVISYGGYTYTLTYERGVLYEITRMEIKENNNGKN